MFNYVNSIDVTLPNNTLVTAGSGTYHIGDALKIASGKYALATGDVAVEAICLEDKTLSADGDLHVMMVTDGMLFEVPIQAYSSSYTKVGSRVTIHTDSAQVTATLSTVLYGSGASASWGSAAALGGSTGAYIVDTQGASAAGDKVIVRLNYFR